MRLGFPLGFQEMSLWTALCTVCPAEFELERPAMPVYEFNIPNHEFHNERANRCPASHARGRPGRA